MKVNVIINYETEIEVNDPIFEELAYLHNEDSIAKPEQYDKAEAIITKRMNLPVANASNLKANESAYIVGVYAMDDTPILEY